MPNNVAYQQIPIGVPTPVLQNETFALPNRAVLVISSAALELGAGQAGPFTAQATTATTGMQTAGMWGRCTTGAATVTAKRI